MRTELCCALALSVFAAAQTARADGWRDRFEVGLAPELTLVGLAGGARAQVAWLPGGPRSVSRVVLAPGLLIGPEFDYVPVSLGYRAVFRAGRVVRPLVGAGVEYQHRDVNDAPAARQLAVYLEGGDVLRRAALDGGRGGGHGRDRRRRVWLRPARAGARHLVVRVAALTAVPSRLAGRGGPRAVGYSAP